MWVFSVFYAAGVSVEHSSSLCSLSVVCGVCAACLLYIVDIRISRCGECAGRVCITYVCVTHDVFILGRPVASLPCDSLALSRAWR